MKITIKLANVPLTVEIEAPDESMSYMADVIAQTFEKMRKAWLETLKRQTKLHEGDSKDE